MITVYRRDVTTIKVHSRSRRGVSAPIFLVFTTPDGVGLRPSGSCRSNPYVGSLYKSSPMGP